jgi:hypothetical protein
MSDESDEDICSVQLEVATGKDAEDMLASVAEGDSVAVDGDIVAVFRDGEHVGDAEAAMASAIEKIKEIEIERGDRDAEGNTVTAWNGEPTGAGLKYEMMRFVWVHAYVMSFYEHGNADKAIFDAMRVVDSLKKTFGEATNSTFAPSVNAKYMREAFGIPWDREAYHAAKERDDS